MARVKKTESTEEVINATKAMEEKAPKKKAPKKKASNNTLNQDGFTKGKALTPEEFARFKAKHR